MSDSAMKTAAVGTEPFPAAVVEAALRTELLQAASGIAAMHGVAMPAGIAQQSALAIQLDSLAVVDAVCALETVVGFEVKEHIVKAGGYNSVNEAITALMPRLEKEWKKHQGKEGKK